MRRMADLISKMLPKGYGFALFVFPFNRPGGVGNYISNATRESMILAIQEKLDKLRSGQDFPTPENTEQ